MIHYKLFTLLGGVAQEDVAVGGMGVEQGPTIGRMHIGFSLSPLTPDLDKDTLVTALFQSGFTLQPPHIDLTFGQVGFGPFLLHVSLVVIGKTKLRFFR